MERVLFYWRELLFGLVLLALVVIVQSVLMYLWRQSAWKSNLVAANGDTSSTHLRRELAAIRLRLDAIEDQLALQSSVDNGGTPSLASPEAERDDVEFAQSPHGQAMLLARDGLDANELSRRCGISLSEASLIVAMQRPRAR
jgi:hypothetical protein